MSAHACTWKSSHAFRVRQDVGSYLSHLTCKKTKANEGKWLSGGDTYRLDVTGLACCFLYLYPALLFLSERWVWASTQLPGDQKQVTICTNGGKGLSTISPSPKRVSFQCGLRTLSFSADLVNSTEAT